MYDSLILPQDISLQDISMGYTSTESNNNSFDDTDQCLKREAQVCTKVIFRRNFFQSYYTNQMNILEKCPFFG
jgi:hypothetical protein